MVPIQGRITANRWAAQLEVTRRNNSMGIGPKYRPYILDCPAKDVPEVKCRGVLRERGLNVVASNAIEILYSCSDCNLTEVLTYEMCEEIPAQPSGTVGPGGTVTPDEATEVSLEGLAEKETASEPEETSELAGMEGDTDGIGWSWWKIPKCFS